MCARAHSPEQKFFDLFREVMVTASRADTKAPQEKQRIISALTPPRPETFSPISFTSLIVARSRWLNRAIAFKT
jgi:hypothetical protein